MAPHSTLLALGALEPLCDILLNAAAGDIGLFGELCVLDGLLNCLFEGQIVLIHRILDAVGSFNSLLESRLGGSGGSAVLGFLSLSCHKVEVIGELIVIVLDTCVLLGKLGGGEAVRIGDGL